MTPCGPMTPDQTLHAIGLVIAGTAAIVYLAQYARDYRRACRVARAMLRGAVR